MKLTSVEIHPEGSSEVAIFSFRDPKAINPYNIKGITGLDAETITPKHYKGSGDASFYNLSLENRNIVIRIGLNPRIIEFETYSDLRDRLYKMVASSRTGKVQLKFKNGLVVQAAIFGFITKVESALFEKDQEIQITVQCDEPMLKAESPVSIVPPALTDFTITDELSTAPHGFSFQLIIQQYAPYIQLTESQYSSPWIFEVLAPGGFQPNDYVIFSSEYNNKGIRIVRQDGPDTQTIQLADKIAPYSSWPIIFPGVNNFHINTADVEWLILSYYPTYWGI